LLHTLSRESLIAFLSPKQFNQTTIKVFLKMPGLRSATLKNVTEAMNKLYPLKYADNTWDNTGLLVDASIHDTTTISTINIDEKANILLTIDLTEDVAQEAIEKECNIIISYHPFLFRKFNKITPFNNSQHRTLLKLIQNQISVYSPHTAVDAAINGVNDWLLDGISNGSYIIKKEVIIPDKSNINGVGMGRIVEFDTPEPLLVIVQRVKTALGIPFVQLATKDKYKTVRRIAICAGSGSSVFSSITEPVDLYYTGELSHHEQLAFVESNKSVIICGHCNTERGFLKGSMLNALQSQLPNSIISVSTNDKSPFTTL
jgi:dinuclear metal center YbgI/SA1388 family protein